jgi:hypothetical protein
MATEDAVRWHKRAADALRAAARMTDPGLSRVMWGIALG